MNLRVGGLWQPVLLYGSLRRQSHVNIYICVVNYAQMRFSSASFLRCEFCWLFYLSTGSQLVTKRTIPWTESLHLNLSSCEGIIWESILWYWKCTALLSRQPITFLWAHLQALGWALPPLLGYFLFLRNSFPTAGNILTPAAIDQTDSFGRRARDEHTASWPCCKPWNTGQSGGGPVWSQIKVFCYTALFFCWQSGTRTHRTTENMWEGSC